MLKYTEQEFLYIISISKSHVEATQKLGYKQTQSLSSLSRYSKLLNKLKPDLSHFGRFTENEFLEAIKTSTSHTQAGKKLGYSDCCTVKKSLYGQFLNKLCPDLSHFKRKKSVKWNIGYTVGSKEYSREYDKIRKKHDIKFKLMKVLRCRFRTALRQNSKKGSAVRDLGCSIEKFKLWMEMHWKDGMSWDNYGKNGWVIDHIKPLCSFNLDDRIELLQACHFSNLQPMWAKDNLKKSDKI